MILRRWDRINEIHQKVLYFYNGAANKEKCAKRSKSMYFDRRNHWIKIVNGGFD